MVEIQYCLFRSVLNFFRKTHDVNRRDLQLFNIIFSKANGQLRLESEDVLIKGRGGWGAGGAGLRQIIVLMFPSVIFWSDTSCIVFY